MSAVVILVAKSDWCPSLSVKSVMRTGFLAIGVSFALSVSVYLLYTTSILDATEMAGNTTAIALGKFNRQR